MLKVNVNDATTTTSAALATTATTVTATATATTTVAQYEKNNNIRYQQIYNNYSVPRTTKITTISDYNNDCNYDNKMCKKSNKSKANGSYVNVDITDFERKKSDCDDDGEEEDGNDYFYDSNCCDEINVKRRSSLIRLSILVLIPASIIAIASVCFGKVA